MSAPAAPYAARVRGLNKSFGDGSSRLHVLKDVEMDVRLGDITMLIGPSGCGKTTLISILAGTLKPDPGTQDLTVLDQDLQKMSTGSRTAEKKAREVLAQVGLGDRAKSRPNMLSGGQQQRVAIARALVHEPRLIICDEPTAALDAKNGQVIMELFESVARSPDRAVLIVTHDNRIFPHANRIASMDDGRIVEVHDKDTAHPLPENLKHGFHQ